MVRVINSKKGNVFLWFFILVLLFCTISVIVLDCGLLYSKSVKVKTSLNEAVKAGALNIEKGDNLADGIFLIKEDDAISDVKQILASNLHLNPISLKPLSNSILSETPIIRELEVVNNTPTTYYSPTFDSHIEIQNPTIVAIFEFKIKGILLTNNIIVKKLSSSQLTSIYD